MSPSRNTQDNDFRQCAAQMLRTLLNSASAGTVLLLEDIDAAFSKQRAAAAAGKDSPLTFSGDLAPSRRLAAPAVTNAYPKYGIMFSAYSVEAPLSCCFLKRLRRDCAVALTCLQTSNLPISY